MRTCHIFCAGGFTGLLEQPKPEDLILAADGGLEHLQALGLPADGILGDFDSLGYVPTGPQVDRYPVEKDDTDSMLAIKVGLQQGCSRFLIYGALDGPRLDHTVANFQALSYLANHGAMGYLIGNTNIAVVLSEGMLRFGPKAEGIISVFCQGSAASGVTLRGLQYPVEKHTLTYDFPLGVSNHFLGQQAEISVEQGHLLILWDRENGLPEWTEMKGMR